jgi:hypothetical protein
MSDLSRERRCRSLDQLLVPPLQARVALGLEPAHAIVVLLRVGLIATGGAAFVVALRLLLGRRSAGSDKSGQHRHGDETVEVRYHARRAPHFIR